MRVTPSFLFAADDDRCLRRMDEPTVGMVRSNRGFDFTTAPSVDTPRRYRAGNVAAGTTLRLRKGGSVYIHFTTQSSPNQQLRTAVLGQIIIYLGLDVDAAAPAVNVHTQTPHVSLSLTHIRARHAVRSCTRALGPRGTPADPSPWTCSRRTWAIAGECSAGQPP